MRFASAFLLPILRTVNKNTRKIHTNGMAAGLKAKLNMLWQKGFGFGNEKQTKSAQVGK